MVDLQKGISAISENVSVVLSLYLARAATFTHGERIVVARFRDAAFRVQEALWVETMRIFPNVRVPVDPPHVCHDIRSCSYAHRHCNRYLQREKTHSVEC